MAAQVSLVQADCVGSHRGRDRTHEHGTNELPRRSERMMFSRMDGTPAFCCMTSSCAVGAYSKMSHCWKMPVVHIVIGAFEPACPSPRCHSASKQCPNQPERSALRWCLQRETETNRQTELEEPVVGAMCDDHFGHLAGHSPTVDATDQSSALAPETLAAESRLLALESNTVLSTSNSPDDSGSFELGTELRSLRFCHRHQGSLQQ